MKSSVEKCQLSEDAFILNNFKVENEENHAEF